MEAHRVLLNCVGGKMLWMLLQNGGTEFMFCLCVVGTHSWKCNRKCCFWQTIVKCEPVLKRAHLSVWVFPCISELLCWRRRLLWGSALSTFPVSHTLSPAPFGISCVCLYVHYLVQFLWPSVIVSQGSAWSHGFLVVLQHLLSATMVCQNSQKIFFCFVVRTGTTMMQEIGQSASERFHQKCSSTNNTYSALFNWPKNAALFSVAAYMYLYMRSLNFHRGWQCTLVL